jgi:predicted nucleotide-binding protein
MKILFQGSWKEVRDVPESKPLIEEYCKELAKFIVNFNHTIVLTSYEHFEKLIADEVSSLISNDTAKLKQHLLFLVSENKTNLPKIGTVHRLGNLTWYQDRRTYLIQQVESLIAIGGGKGTSDCIQKAILTNKPVFVAGQIVSSATKTWKNRVSSYQYVTANDTSFTEDLNMTPAAFFQQVAAIMKKQAEAFEYSRNIFIVHGRDHHERDILVSILKKLEFFPIVLDKEPNNGLTIIEKLERYINDVGFGFILYTPDDIGKLKDGDEKPRGRQNVIFEHGYLYGQLGRDRTCALLKTKIEFPSDLEGVVYEKYSDLEHERIRIATILKDAGYNVDASKLV